MNTKCLLLVALTLVASVAARHVRDAPQNVELPNSFADFFEQASKGWKQLEKAVFDGFGVENSEQLEKKAIEQGKEYANKLDEWAIDVKKETDNLQDNAIVKDLRNTIDKTIEDWKAKNPETTEDIKKYMEKANQNTDQIINKIKQLGESEDAKHLKELSTKLLENAANTFKTLAEDIQKNVSPKN